MIEARPLKKDDLIGANGTEYVDADVVLGLAEWLRQKFEDIEWQQASKGDFLELLDKGVRGIR